MYPVTLPVYHKTEGVLQKEKLGIDWSYEECEIRDGIFYVIQALFPFECPMSGKELSEIVSGDMTCVVALTQEQTHDRILEVNPHLIPEIGELNDTIN